MLIFAEGFDGIGTSGAPLYESELFDYVNTAYCAFSTDYGRLNIGVQASSHPSIGKSFTMSGSTMIFGIAIYRFNQFVQSDGASGNEYLTFFSGGVGATKQITVTRDSTGTELQIRSGSYNGSVLATTSFSQELQTWYYLELKVVINASTGSVELKIDGNVVASASGVNTDPAGSGSFDYVELTGSSTYHVEYFDDWYICDGSGSYNTDYLGDVNIECLAPTSDGADQDFALSTGTDGYALVDEIPASDTDYVEGDAVAERFSVGVTAANDGRTIYGVMINQLDINPDVGTMGIKLFANNNASENQSAEFTVGSTEKRRFFVVERDPDSGGAWTYSILNASEFGVEITS